MDGQLEDGMYNIKTYTCTFRRPLAFENVCDWMFINVGSQCKANVCDIEYSERKLINKPIYYTWNSSPNLPLLITCVYILANIFVTYATDIPRVVYPTLHIPKNTLTPVRLFRDGILSPSSSLSKSKSSAFCSSRERVKNTSPVFIANPDLVRVPEEFRTKPSTDRDVFAEEFKLTSAHSMNLSAECAEFGCVSIVVFLWVVTEYIIWLENVWISNRLIYWAL